MTEDSNRHESYDTSGRSCAHESSHTLALSTKICRRLPREIRSLIYSHLDLHQQTKYFKPIDHLTSTCFYSEFSRECLLWYYENVPQILHHPFITDDIEYFMRSCTSGKKIPGLTIIVEGTRTENELKLPTKAVDRLKATGYFDDINWAFEVRVYIDMTQNLCWRSVNPEIESAVKTVQPVVQFFKERTAVVGCFARLMHVDDEEAREDGLDLTEYMDESVDEILEYMGIFQYTGACLQSEKEVIEARTAAETRKRLIEAL